MRTAPPPGESRRSFLAKFGAGAAALSAAPRAAAAPASPAGGEVRLAIATICTDGFSNRQHEPALATIPTLGFEHVEFNLWYPGTITPSYLESIKTRSAAAGLTVASLQSNAFGHCGREGFAKDVAHKLWLIDACRRLGGRGVKFTGARRGQEGGIDAVIATCREIAPAAIEQGVIVTLENHAKNVLEQVEDYDRVFSAIDSPSVGMCLDTGHFEGVGVDVHEVIDRFGPRILQVDLKDCRERGAGHDTVPFGQGVTDFEAILSHLMEAGFSGDLVVEQAWPEPRGDWKSDLRSAYERFEKWRRP